MPTCYACRRSPPAETVGTTTLVPACHSRASRQASPASSGGARHPPARDRAGRRQGHVLASRPLLAFYKHTEIHNELLHDESSAFATDVKFPESDHAPVIAELSLP